MTDVVQHGNIVRDHLLDICRACGAFDTVREMPPLGAGVGSEHGVHAAVLDGQGRAVPQLSTLNHTTAWFGSTIHLWTPLDEAAGPESPAPFEATVIRCRDTVIAALHNRIVLQAGYELDPMGVQGTPVSWLPGMIELADKSMQRTQSITIGCIVFNAWEQIR